MSRYLSIPRGAYVRDDVYGWGTSIIADVAFEQDAGPIKTGLLDSCGDPIVRVIERGPLGFQLRPAAPPDSGGMVKKGI